MSQVADELPCKVGDAVLIRTVTMIQIGRIKRIGEQFITLEDGGWVAETGRFGQTLAEGALAEFERAPSWIVVGLGAIVDMYQWAHDIPQKTI